MDCLLLPYYNYLFSLIYNWENMDDKTKMRNIESTIKCTKELEKLFKNSKSLLHIQHYTNTFKIDNNSVKLNLEELYMAYDTSKDCNLCCSCNNILSDFYCLCAGELFSKDSIIRFNEEWNKKIETISIESKTNLTPIDKKLLCHINVHRDSIISQYINKTQRNRSLNYEDNFLLILKGMSSSSPWIYNNTTNRKFSGGGFFIRWNGLGIAIDPGYNFIDNLHENRLNIYDIDIVIVTHNHIDHNHDIRLIDDLNKCSWRKTKHKIKWYLDESTYNASKYFLEDFSTINSKDTSDESNIIEYKEQTSIRKEFQINENCKIIIFPTFHIQNDSAFSNDSFGIKIDLLREGKIHASLGYTSDTHYEPSITNHLKGSNIIIANISGIYEDDIKKINYKKRHLGYFGCYSLIKGVEDTLKLFLISEFWSGNDDIRFDIAKHLQSECRENSSNKKIKVLPADIGMKVSLEQTYVKCDMCDDYSCSSHAIRPKEDFSSIKYICDGCIL